MLFRSLLEHFVPRAGSRPRARAKLRPRNCGLAVESLEDRLVPATLAVGDATLIEGNAGTTNALVTVRLSGTSNPPVSVNYSTANGTALAGSDYQAASGTLTFKKGETSKTILVPVIGDRLHEPDETFSSTSGMPRMRPSPTVRASSPSPTTIPCSTSTT